MHALDTLRGHYAPRHRDAEWTADHIFDLSSKKS